MNDSNGLSQMLVIPLSLRWYLWSFIIFITACSQPSDSSHKSESKKSVTFAVLGDYGFEGVNEAKVATLIKSWNPDFILTTGDNNYPDGSKETIDQNIGQYFSEYIFPYHGKYSKGSDVNRFFPTIGNHDTFVQDGAAYYEYFELNGNERYYDFVQGDVHFFALNSTESEPDGIDSSSGQAQWLREGLKKSEAPWKIVYFHHPPYSTSSHGDTDWMQWPFKDWGASVVLSGHDHVYQRLVVDGLTYLVNGLGGESRYEFFEENTNNHDVRGSYNADFGALKVHANAEKLTFEFHSITDGLIDKFELENQAGTSQKLFATDEFLNLTIETDLVALLADRSYEAEYQKALVSIDGSEPIPMQLKVRGNFRRSEDNCQFPPLWLKISDVETAKIYFNNDKKIKIVNPCAIDATHEQYIAQEFLAYKIFNILTDSSFLVQPLTIEYRDTVRLDTITTFSFFIENAKSIGGRIGAKKIKEASFRPILSNYHSTALVDFFQLMLGNADWYFPDHNLMGFAASSQDTLLIPYDFDLSGIVNADYSHMSHEMEYRGFCHSDENYTRIINHFNNKREGIVNLYKNTELLDDENRMNSLRRIETFYAIINDRSKFTTEVVGLCNEKPLQ